MDILQNLHLRVGGKVELQMKDKKVYVTRIEDANSKHLMVSAPQEQGQPVTFYSGEQITVGYILETGRFGLPVKVIGNKRELSARLLVLQPTGPPRRQLLRGAYRLPVALSGIMRIAAPAVNPIAQLAASGEVAPKPKPIDINFTTQDISEGGLSFKARVPYEVNEKVGIRIWLEWPMPRALPISFFGEIIRCDQTKDGYFHIGIKYIKIDEETRKHLSRYILTKQQEIIKRRRRAEDD